MVPYCMTCQKEMTCTENGAVMRRSKFSAISVDIFECLDCGALVAANGGKPFQVSETQPSAIDLTKEEGERNAIY